MGPRPGGKIVPTRGRAIYVLIGLLFASCAHAVWMDSKGRPVPISILSEEKGGCPGTRGWKVLTLRGRHFVQDPHRAFPPNNLSEPYQAHARLPREVRFSGYHEGDRQIWIVPGLADQHIYVAEGRSVELWPRATLNFGCA